MRLPAICLLLVMAGCGRHHVPPSKGVLCVWPDPIEFTLADDNWKVCFQVDHSNYTAFKPTCMTVAELRHLIIVRQFAP
jgi:hypothetical protein